MDRLTARAHDGHAYLANVKDDEQEVECRSRNTAQCIMDSWERLAAYEDTGLEPEEIKQMCALARLNSNIFDNDFGNHIAELIVAEQDGRLVVLPCKVGDTLYVDKRTIVDGWRVKGVSAELATGKVVAFSTNKQSAFIKIEFFYNQGEKTFRDRYVISAIGKTVFLTRAEAEAALKDAHKQGGEQDG